MPFHHARQAALDLRAKLFPKNWVEGIPSNDLILAAASEDGEDFVVDAVKPSDLSLGGADALLLRDFRQILVRDDVSDEEQAFLIAHEFGHWKLHPEEHEGCHKVVESSLEPEKADTFGTQKVEAYGAKERAELQANIFAKEFLLPRKTAEKLYLEGKTAREIARSLSLPLELVRQQLLDALLLPEPPNLEDVESEPVIYTDEQKKAAFSGEQISLVVAGPGTGKTTTLLLRIQHLFSKGAKPSEILVLTFSNRAARELVDRLQLLGIKDVHDIWVGTFHTFGLEFLRKNHEYFGLQPSFGVADKLAQIALLEGYIHDVGLKAFSLLGDPLDWLNDVVTVIQRAKDELADPVAYRAAVEECAETTQPDVLARCRDVAALYERYETEKGRSGRLADLGDLVMLPALALRSDRPKFDATVGRFRHILVDEYQDVNRASAALIKALASHAISLWVVGDPRQAIYRFRGASMRNVVRFNDDFPAYKEFSLSENKRSFEEIVQVFEHTGTESHPLQGVLPLDGVRAVRGVGGTRPIRLVCDGEDVVHHELVEHVRQLASSGVPFRKQVVLASTHRICGAAAEALIRSGVPALYLGDIFQRAEVKNLLSLLQVFIDRSGSGLIRLAQLPELAIPAEDVETVLQWLRANRPEPLSWLCEPPPGLSREATVALAKWSKVFRGLRSTDSPWDVMCELLLERTTLLQPYLSGDGIVDITRRIALWQFIYFLRAPDGAQPYQTVGSFITRLRRRLRVNDDRELRIPPPEADSLDAVAVMTIHQSKGLEFEAVHLVDVDASHFKVGKDSPLIPESLLDSIVQDSEFEGRTEASNKLYVALSRARKHLILYENTKSRWNAQCVPAVTAAAHLFETKQGGTSVTTEPSAARVSSPEIAVSESSGEVDVQIDVEKFISYVVCPMRYFYDHKLGLTPSSGLPPSVLVEAAVIEELFAPESSSLDDLDESPGTLDQLFASFIEWDNSVLLYLRAYAEQLLDNGRRWLGAARATLPGSVDVECAGVTVRLTPHQIFGTGPTYTLRFFRARPFGKGSRQEKVFRWMLRQLNDKHPDKSFNFEVCVLSTGDVIRITPYQRPPDFLLNAIGKLRAKDYTPKLGGWDCPKCRHFMYCPA